MLLFLYWLLDEEQNNFSKKSYLQWGLNLGSLVIHSDVYLTELTWQVLIEGYLTSLLLVHLDDLAKINTARL